MAYIELLGYKKRPLQHSVVKLHERYQSLKKGGKNRNMSLHTFTPTKEKFQQYYSIPFSVFFCWGGDTEGKQLTRSWLPVIQNWVSGFNEILSSVARKIEYRSVVNEIWSQQCVLWIFTFDIFHIVSNCNNCISPCHICLVSDINVRRIWWIAGLKARLF
jgi:hypothetical protein